MLFCCYHNINDRISKGCASAGAPLVPTPLERHDQFDEKSTWEASNSQIFLYNYSFVVFGFTYLSACV